MPRVEFQKPYTIDEIRKHPYAVVISLLIGILLLSISWNVYNDYRKNKKIEALTDQRDEEKQKRIDLYEGWLFYKSENERLKDEQSTSDSLVRERTQPFVRRFLKP